MIWIFVIIAVSLFGVMSGIFMIVGGITRRLDLPRKDRWYSGLYRPGKGSEGVIVLVGVVWVIMWSVALYKFSWVVIENHW